MLAPVLQRALCETDALCDFSDGDQLFGANDDSLRENLKRYPGLRSEDFKRGRWTPGEVYDRVLQVVLSDYERP